ncbi:TPA: hypothetical protein ACIZB4_000489 [Legionella pneumophila]|uniref:hypothetical protein n=1 Tax=Legionella pneumophila TaxID=446 RepID=UPI000787F885|nr:hypothetical protein [Legionella pneumophila]MCZ4700573.1 hypothetical protein [Legionella pneumophila]MCZ4731610.1 hypothetical protein [Legionella pneumophila]MCZ4752554.1 hypothetical protein [Legionella pneumophila]MDW9049914.1 hypothetical protein [Legionella pneumophila]MDW9059305.1 hypothetical protein [Legionella pneumophila]
MSKCLNAVYFDESGNTEQGFKDKSQPCITFASHNFSENNCKIILKSHFPGNQAKEVKYSNLGKKGRVDKCFNVLTELKKREGSCFKAYSVYKPLYLFHSFLTLFHDSAYEEKYPNKSHITGDPDWTFSRMHDLWFHFIRIKGLDYILKLIELYSSLIKEGSEKGFESLIKHIEILTNECEHAALIYNWILNTTFEGTVKLINGESFQDEFIKPSWLDTTLPCMIQLLNHWTYFFDGKNFDVVHDASWVLKKREWVIDKLKGITKDKPRILNSKLQDKCFMFFLITYQYIALNLKIQKIMLRCK